MTPPGFCLKSLPRQSGTGGGLAVYIKLVLQNTLQFLLKISFSRLLRYVKCVFPMMVILWCSSVFTVPHLVDRTNAMFLEQFSDLLESYVSCNRLFVVGDVIVHFGKPSDPSTSALNAVLDNLRLHQLVNVPTYRRGHTLDWLITNRATDVFDLTVVEHVAIRPFCYFF